MKDKCPFPVVFLFNTCFNLRPSLIQTGESWIVYLTFSFRRVFVLLNPFKYFEGQQELNSPSFQFSAFRTVEIMRSNNIGEVSCVTEPVCALLPYCSFVIYITLGKQKYWDWIITIAEVREVCFFSHTDIILTFMIPNLYLFYTQN